MLNNRMGKYRCRIAIVLVLCIVASMISIQGYHGSEVLAEVDITTAIPSGDWFYRLQDDGLTIVKYVGNDPDVRIPEEIDGHVVTTIGENAFYGYVSEGGTLVIPKSVIRIETGAFSCCNFGGELALPENLKYIGELAFNCNIFTGVLEIPEQVEEIGSLAFYSNRFTGVSLPPLIKEIKDNTFGFCWGLSGTLTIPDGVVKIEDYAFKGGGFSEVLMPDSVKWIGGMLFDSPALEKVVIPGETVWIDDKAFFYCPSVTIYGYSGSTVQAYADKKGIPFAELEATPSPSPTQTAQTTQRPAGLSDPAMNPGESIMPIVTMIPMPDRDGELDDSDNTDMESTGWVTGIQTGQLSLSGVRDVPDDFPKIKWKKNKIATGYEIARSSKKNTGYRKIQSLSAAQTEFTDRKAKRGKQYYYKIRAVYDKGNPILTGEWSKPIRLKCQYLNMPVVTLKKVKKYNETLYLKLKIKKSEGKQIQIYFKKGKKKKMVRLRSSKIKRSYRLQYKIKAKHMTFYIRTYVKEGKKTHYSRFMVVKI